MLSPANVIMAILSAAFSHYIAGFIAYHYARLKFDQRPYEERERDPWFRDKGKD